MDLLGTHAESLEPNGKEMENRKQETGNGKLINWPVFHLRFSVSCFSFPSCVARIALLSILILAALSPVARQAPATTKAAPAKQAAKTSRAQKTTPANFVASFQTFCEDWMHKLHAREVDNVTHIKWESNADGTRGTYVGYSQDHKCEVKEDAKIGRVDYREFTYEKRGSTIAEAEKSAPRPVEVYDATEIFHCEKGKWDY
jgi:hypothetical protein